MARTNSHFGGVEEGTQFAISDLRSFIDYNQINLVPLHQHCIVLTRSDFRCKGDEEHLLHCPHTALRSCGIAEVAGVTCIQNEGDLQTSKQGLP